MLNQYSHPFASTISSPTSFYLRYIIRNTAIVNILSASYLWYDISICSAPYAHGMQLVLRYSLRSPSYSKIASRISQWKVLPLHTLLLRSLLITAAWQTLVHPYLQHPKLMFTQDVVSFTNLLYSSIWSKVTSAPSTSSTLPSVVEHETKDAPSHKLSSRCSLRDLPKISLSTSTDHRFRPGLCFSYHHSDTWRSDFLDFVSSCPFLKRKRRHCMEFKSRIPMHYYSSIQCCFQCQLNARHAMKNCVFGVLYSHLAPLTVLKRCSYHRVLHCSLRDAWLVAGSSIFSMPRTTRRLPSFT